MAYIDGSPLRLASTEAGQKVYRWETETEGSLLIDLSQLESSINASLEDESSWGGLLLKLSPSPLNDGTHRLWIAQPHFNQNRGRFLMYSIR